MDFNRLSESFNQAGAGRDALADAFNSTEAAADYEPIPAGEYTARLIGGELFSSRNGTPGWRATFEIIDGPHAGRTVRAEYWLSGKALPFTRRDLSKIGINRFEQLRGPIVPTHCRVRVALRRNDDGTLFNTVRDAVAITGPGGSIVTPAPIPVSMNSQHETPAASVTADELPAGLVDAGLM